VEKGLEPLAKIIFGQEKNELAAIVTSYINDKVPDTEDALKGARDIIAEWINEDAALRDQLRKLFARTAPLKSKVIEGKEEEGNKYKDYFDFSERLSSIPSHRVLAIFRGESDGFLYATIAPGEEESLQLIQNHCLKNNNESGRQVLLAATDAYKRLLRPSLENEFRAMAKEKADSEAIEVFAENLRQLLLTAPLGPKPVLAIDPGYRTGCKTVALDEQGNLLTHAVIFPLEKNYKKEEAAALLKEWVQKYHIAAIAIGNGTAGRETEEFVNGIDFERKPLRFMVNENGASVYSASAAAREEFPEYDVTVRGAVSIGRRLMDPLAELVKIDPKSIGVGQYQHDVNQSQLKQSLDRVVVSCVNNVGVNLNTASQHLLAYVSGLGASLAENVIKYRKENGAFRNRHELKKVPRLGDKAFEQCAGFLRIGNGDNPLDNSAVHPERYTLVEKMAAGQGCSVADLLRDEALRKKIRLNDYLSEQTGLLTLQDILNELDKPGRDPRGEVAIFNYTEGIKTIEDLKAGMILSGVITNITNFGAFVDIGVKQDGLVHISHLSHRYITNPNEVVKLNQQVKVTVLETDVPRKRISLSIKAASPAPAAPSKPPSKKNEVAPADDLPSALAALKKKFS
ncbi:MAG TPA: helix-hairpin-helix domain-containing protein, partial [Chitinophagaceae bacterium]